MKFQLQWELQLPIDVIGQRHYCYIRVLYLIDQCNIYYLVKGVNERHSCLFKYGSVICNKMPFMCRNTCSSLVTGYNLRSILGDMGVKYARHDSNC